VENKEPTQQPHRGPFILLASLIVAAAIIAGALIVVNAMNDANRTQRCNELRDSMNDGSPSFVFDIAEAEEMGCDWAK
jgi:hypothetical protein